MEWNEKLQCIIDLVETQLQQKEEPIDQEEIALIAQCSYPFFQKVFSYMNGISFAEYIRKRKLTLAGYDIKSSTIKIIDLSYKYGYDSPTSFTKAFLAFHGVSPKQARDTDIQLHVFPKMKIHHKQAYKWRIERKPAMRLIGASITIDQADAKTSIPAFWSECQRNGVFAKLISLDQANAHGMFGLFTSYHETTNQTQYAIMVSSDEMIPEGFIGYIVPECTWAVFDCTGMIPHAIQRGWEYLTSEWLLQYPFKHAVCPEIEWYSDGNVYDENYLSQIWIPIIEED